MGIDVMKKLFIVVILAMSVSVSAATNFEGMLQAAKSGDSMARVLVAYTYYFGEFRDGTKKEKNLNKAYAWASLASYQGEPEAKKLVNDIIPMLENRVTADSMAEQYFKRYGANKSSAKPQKIK